MSMIFGSNRQQLRHYYFDAWQKHLKQETLSALEQQIVDVIIEHPEYQATIASQVNHDKEWFAEQGETNPFLHLGMHLAIREQLSIDQPTGIRNLTRNLLQRMQDAHQVEHAMIDCLVEAIWQAQHKQQEPDMQAYFSCLQRL